MYTFGEREFHDCNKAGIFFFQIGLFVVFPQEQTHKKTTEQDGKLMNR